MRNYVIINGVNSLTIQGLAIKTLPPITKPIQRNLREEIDGRDGDIVTTLGYGAYDKTIEIGLFGTFDIDEVIAYFNQKGTITFSNEADKVYYFEALDQVDYAELLKFRTANVVLHCQPFKYPLNETPLVEEYEYVEATGTNVTLDNTSEAIFNKIDLKGNTSQETTTGKNLLNVESNGSSIGGVPFTIENGVIKINGTTSSSPASFYFNTFQTNSGSAVYWIEVTGYTDKSSGNSALILQQSDDGTTGWSTFNELSLNSAYLKQNSVTLDSSKYYRLRWYVDNNTFTNATIKVQLEYGSNKTAFEPYTNGASPNPNYPQDIHVVSGDNEISITGRNLLEPNSFAQKVIDSPYSSANASTYNSETGELSIKMGNRSVVFDNFKPNTQYTIILKYNIATNGSNLECWYTDNSYDNITPTAGSGTFRFVTRAGKSVASIKHSAYDSTMPRTLYLKESGIFEGVIQETEFEPFGKVYPINLGVENLFDKDNAKHYSTDGSGNTTTTNYFNSTDYIPCNANDSFTISGIPKTQNDYNFKVVFFDSSKNYISRPIAQNGINNVRGSYSTTAPTNAKYVIAQFYNTLEEAQFEKGTKASSFSPYGQTPIELCKIGDYQDYFVRNSGKNLFNEEQLLEATGWAKSNGVYSGIIDNFYSKFRYGFEGLTFETNTQYTISLKGYTTGGTPRIKIVYTDATTEQIEISANSLTAYTKTSSSSKTISSIQADFGTGSSNTLYLTQFAIKKGTVAIYEPYGTGLWCKYNAIGSITLDGSESWIAETSGGYATNPYFRTTNYTFITTYQNIMSNYFIGKNISATTTGGIQKSANLLLLQPSNGILTASDFKTWLGTHNTKVVAPLTTPYLSLIESQTLINQLDAIEKALSKDGQTNISQTNNDLPFILDLSALKENSDHLVIDNIGNIYSKPTLDLEGTGIVDIYLNDTQMFEVDLSEKNEIVIDTEKMEAYNPTDNTLANRQVTGDYSKFKLDSGENDLRFSGDLTKATITRYERWL